jgi:ribonucleotide monophosphatase NagD (HAD superfamily)
LIATGKPFQIFTKNSRFTPRDHATRLRAAGFPVKTEHIYTSALATARLLELQQSGSSVYVIGDHGLVDMSRANPPNEVRQRQPRPADKKAFSVHGRELAEPWPVASNATVRTNCRILAFKCQPTCGSIAIAVT